LNDHLPKAEVVIIAPKTTSLFQSMYTRVTAKIKTYYLRTNFVARREGYWMKCKSKKAKFLKRYNLYNSALSIAKA
jgi:hypothetical protein